MISDTPLQILIVDDNALLRASLLHALTHAGHNVRSAHSGSNALAAMEKETPDLLLSDLNMPGLSGFELLSMVRRRFPAVHVIAMSGAYFGDKVPPGVFADAFYEKGRGLDRLMQIVADIVSGDHPLEAYGNPHSGDD